MQLGLAAEKKARHLPAAPHNDDNGDDVMKITPELVRDLLNYDPETGFFTWKRRDRHYFATNKGWAVWNGKYAGKRAGTVWNQPKIGYQNRHICLFNKKYLEHRLAWLYMIGDPIPEQLDHRDQDGTNNSWENIRASDASGNKRNLTMRRSNTSGVTGVGWCKARGKWEAHCRFDGKKHNLGLFNDINEAARVVAEFREKNGFDQRHGAKPAHYRT